MKPRTARKGIIAAIAAVILSAALPAMAMPQDSGAPDSGNVVDSELYAVPEPASTMLAVCLGACFLLRRPMRGAFPKTLEQDELFATQ
jgi:hypothetical protein